MATQLCVEKGCVRTEGVKNPKPRKAHWPSNLCFRHFQGPKAEHAVARQASKVDRRRKTRVNARRRELRAAKAAA